MNTWYFYKHEKKKPSLFVREAGVAIKTLGHDTVFICGGRVKKNLLTSQQKL